MYCSARKLVHVSVPRHSQLSRLEIFPKHKALPKWALPGKSLRPTERKQSTAQLKSPEWAAVRGPDILALINSHSPRVPEYRGAGPGLAPQPEHSQPRGPVASECLAPWPAGECVRAVLGCRTSSGVRRVWHASDSELGSLPPSGPGGYHAAASMVRSRQTWPGACVRVCAHATVLVGV